MVLTSLGTISCGHMCSLVCTDEDSKTTCSAVIKGTHHYSKVTILHQSSPLAQHLKIPPVYYDILEYEWTVGQLCSIIMIMIAFR